MRFAIGLGSSGPCPSRPSSGTLPSRPPPAPRAGSSPTPPRPSTATRPSPPGTIWQSHEGDWEVVNVVLSAAGEPLLVGLSQHCSGETRRTRRRAREPRPAREGGRRAGRARPAGLDPLPRRLGRARVLGRAPSDRHGPGGIVARRAGVPRGLAAPARDAGELAPGASLLGLTYPRPGAIGAGTSPDVRPSRATESRCPARWAASSSASARAPSIRVDLRRRRSGMPVR
jgi:hypothetical protein